MSYFLAKKKKKMFYREKDTSTEMSEDKVNSKTPFCLFVSISSIFNERYKSKRIY